MVKSLYKKVLENYKMSPSETKKLVKQIDAVLKKIKSGLKNNKIKAEVVLGGSAAKGTFLKDDFDVDVFVRFDIKQNKGKDISLLLEKALSGLKFEKIHGSRDYFHVKSGNLNFEIIPVLKIRNCCEAENVTDMSPFHVIWVKKHISVKLKDEVLLAKLFCKASGVYGAESYIHGFSGHVLDILVIYYGSFEKLLKNAINWKKKQVIDFHKVYDGKNVLKILNKSKLVSPLIIIDPIDAERNAAAALNGEKFAKFKNIAKLFLKKPSEKFFVKEKTSVNGLKKKYSKYDLFVFNVKALEGKEDVVGSKIMKAFNYMKKQLELNDFGIVEANWEFDKKQEAMLWFVIKKGPLSIDKEHMGPPLKEKKAVVAFKKKHKKAYERKSRLYAKVARDFRQSKKCLEFLIKDKYVKEKVKKIRFV